MPTPLAVAALALATAITVTVTADCPVDGFRRHLALPVAERPDLAESAFATTPLSRAQAEEVTTLAWSDLAERIRAETADAWADGRIELDGDTMRFLVRRYGAAPAGRRSLWISLHGGGGTTPEVNDQQWRNQIRLYRPDEGVYVAPRALQNTWDLWHEPRIDRFLVRMIECAVVHEGVDPDRVYLLGYSAGGDGLYRLAPRLADRLAAASMMAGHPGDADPRSLRNLPFSIQMGERDTPYERNVRAAEWRDRLAELQSADPGGYPHLVTIHEGLGHWMQLRDAFVIEWMQRHTRHAWPRRVVWHQHAVTHPALHWLGVDGDDRRRGTTVIAERHFEPRAEAAGQRIEIVEADVGSLTIWLHDGLVDLDEPLRVTFEGRDLFTGRVDRTIGTIVESIESRRDPRLAASARVTVSLVRAEESGAPDESR